MLKISVTSFCDCCGKEIYSKTATTTPFDETTPISKLIPMTLSFGEIIKTRAVHWHLCPACMIPHLELLKTLRKKAPLEERNL